MKGIIFNLLEQIVRDEHGEAAWDTLLDKADLDGVYTSLGSYPDEDLGKLVTAAAEMLGLPPGAVVHYVGRKALPLLAVRFPHFFERYANARSFILALNDIIHPEVRKLYKDALTPEFVFDTSDPKLLVMEYRSPRRMCLFAEGMVEGVADHYNETLDFKHARCVHKGDPVCVFHVVLTSREKTSDIEPLRERLAA